MAQDDDNNNEDMPDVPPPPPDDDDDEEDDEDDEGGGDNGEDDEEEEAAEPEPAAASSSRWTCEACGCNTNTGAETTCSICGTSNAGPSLFRRGAGGSLAAARAGWFMARTMGSGSSSGTGGGHAAAAAALFGDAMDEDDLWEHMVASHPHFGSSGGGGGNSDDAAAASMMMPGVESALEQLGVRSSSHDSTSRLRLMQMASRAFETAAAGRAATARGSSAAVGIPAPSVAHRLEASELYEIATEQVRVYEPRWAQPATLPSAPASTTRTRSAAAAAAAASAGEDGSTNPLQVGEGNRQALAHLPAGAGEGYAIRAAEPLPRTASSARDFFGLSLRSTSRTAALTAERSNEVEDAPQEQAENDASATGLGAPRLPSSSGGSGDGGSTSRDERRKQNIVGFKVAFDNPNCEVGGDMGGCYLIGVASSSFTGYNERNSLQQSPFFWGVEDSGQKYEGSQSILAGGSLGLTARRRAGASAIGAIGVRLEPQEAPLNDAGVLFGAREVVTVIVDLEARTMSFWRDDTQLGTLVEHLPRSGNLYPVAMPFNCGVMVAITSIHGDPLATLDSFATDWQREQREHEVEKRRSLAAQRSRYIVDGKLTVELQAVLKTIFAMYGSGRSEQNEQLEYTAAARLWYRSGLKLSALDAILSNESSKRLFTLDDFLTLFVKLAAEDAVIFRHSSSQDGLAFQVNDKVELMEGYEKYGDATGGPMEIGDRGTVVELQNANSGDRQSVRVLYNGRRWWYKAQALQSERSGLIAGPAVWFAGRILRAHGYDETSLTCLAGKPLSEVPPQHRDVVVPKESLRSSESHDNAIIDLFGRVSSNLGGARSRDNLIVTVETVSPEFAATLDLSTGASEDEPSGKIRSLKVPISKLIYGTFQPGPSGDASAVTAHDEAQQHREATVDTVAEPLSDYLNADIAGLANLEPTAIESMLKECKVSSENLANMFSSGLPGAILAAIAAGREQMSTLEPREDLSDRLAALGNLALFIADQVFSERPATYSNQRYDSVVDENDIELVQPEANDADETGSQDDQDMPMDEDEDEEGDVPRLMDGGEEVDEDDEGSAGERRMAGSLQQRRSMLLDLMSSARQSDSSAAHNFFAEMMEVGLGSGGLPPPFDIPNAAQGLPLGLDLNNPTHRDRPARGDIAGFRRNQDRSGTTNDASLPVSSPSAKFESVLDTYMRGRGPPRAKRSSSAPKYEFVRQLVEDGLVCDNEEWTRALIALETSKLRSKSASLLRFAQDETGSAVIDIALALGCSKDLLRCLIGAGCVVGTSEVNKAIALGSPTALGLLLQNCPVAVSSIDVSTCSDEIRRVVNAAKNRQVELEASMKDAANDFVSMLVARLVDLALFARRYGTARHAACAKAICDLLVGNALLKALQKCQVIHYGSEENAAAALESDRSGRFPVGALHKESSSCANGLTGCIPVASLHVSFFGSHERAIKTIGLIEELLCTKDIGDAAAGLTLLSIVLRRFAGLNEASGLKRFGLDDLLTFQDQLANNRLSGIAATVETGAGRSSDESSGIERAVVCPKQHTAVLHVTRHSSFRCDLCGNGVDRGRPMHGCRECDWDACESCTDKAEGGTIKYSVVKKLVHECRGLLREKVPVVLTDHVSQAAGMLSRNDTSNEVDKLAAQIVQLESSALAVMTDLLIQEGKVSFHQFLTTLLPALHSAVVKKFEDVIDFAASSNRNKKPRVVDSDNSIESSRLRVMKRRQHAFCQDVLAALADASDTREASESAAVHLGKSSEDDGDEVGALGSHPANRITNPAAVARLDGAAHSELVRRLHQVLELYETAHVAKATLKRKGSQATDPSSDLQMLKKPLEVELRRSTVAGRQDGEIDVILHVEPLVTLGDIKAQVIRAFCRECSDYHRFGSQLAKDRAMIIERTRDSDEMWRLGRIMAYDEKTGTHNICNAIAISETDRFCASSDSTQWDGVVFDEKPRQVLLAVRDYRVIARSYANETIDDTAPVQATINPTSGPMRDLQQAIGRRVESNVGPGSVWTVYTLVGVQVFATSTEESPDMRFSVLADNGEAFSGTSIDSVRILDGFAVERRSGAGSGRSSRDPRELFTRSNPFLASRGRSALDAESDTESARFAGTLRRSWSALALVDEMRPVDLNAHLLTNTADEDSKMGAVDEESDQRMVDAKDSENETAFDCRVGNNVKTLSVEFESEKPPVLDVLLNTAAVGRSSIAELSDCVTLVKALKVSNQQSHLDWTLHTKTVLFFSIVVKFAHCSGKVSARPSREPEQAGASLLPMRIDCFDESVARKRPGKHRPFKFESLVKPTVGAVKVCDGLDEIGVQCVDIIDMIAEATEDSSISADMAKRRAVKFSNQKLSSKLLEQLDDAVSVVGGALPSWCTAAPSMYPRLFTYSARRALLERAAFGPSRSTLRQQDAKVNVGRFRQRMASLRARAVELVGEAFSGGAEDPTALQLQADELYGMEEALAARVRAGFRSVKWREHALQVAKGAVRRNNLLQDAAVIMERYAAQNDLCHRRLEARFDGESGFDAASGDEAGVTRGFYADVAEALLSTDKVAGVFCATSCAAAAIKPSIAKEVVAQMVTTDADDSSKLPLWIPDVDATGQVVIPTPRADERSFLGIYPRPIPRYHPQIDEVLQEFRFMGRLFAAAMRDGFMFPLPLSAAFLKLVQHGTETELNKSAVREPNGPGVPILLSNADLPRPGFLGGEIFAAEEHVCRSLDEADAADPPLSRLALEKCYEDIATDPTFARVALGKSYDCSFEEYFQERTFVDPLDPTQGVDATPLCPGGHDKPVTIYNIREWVELAKLFFLHDGVIAQALAFRAGVQDFFDATFLRIFTPNELQHDVCGVGDNVDSWDDGAVRKLFKLDGGKGAAEALVAVAAMGGEGGVALSRRFGPGSPTINFLVKALLDSTPKQRRQFLSFVTSVPIVTPGQIEVVPMVSPIGEFLPMQDPSCLPRANTCARRLYLPKFDTQESFADVLWAVVREESKFKGFYEWRGS